MMAYSVIPDSVLHELGVAAREAPDGDFVEVGVYRGGSASCLAAVASEASRRLFLFDTFCGIPFAEPERGDTHRVGDFGDTSLESVQQMVPTAICIPGIFPETLIAADVGPIALAHIDCDQYRSVRDCCIELGPRMVSGGVMIFDDYDCLHGARAAVEECFPGRVELSPQGKARVYF